MTFFAVVAALTSSWSGIRLGALNIADVATVAGAAVFVARGIAGKPAHLPIWCTLPAFFGLVLVGRDVVIYGFSLTDPADTSSLSTAQMLTRVAFSTLGASVLCAGVQSVGRKSLVRVFIAWGAGIGISSLVAVAQSLNLVPVSGLLVQVNGVGRFAGLSSHPNALAQTIVLLLPFILLAVFSIRGWRWLIVAFLACIAGLALYQSGSRAGLLVGFAAVVVSAFALGARAGALKWAIPVIALAIGAAILFAPRVISTTRFAAESNSSASDVDRVQSLATGWADFASHPWFGAGMGVWVGELAPLVIVVSGGVGYLLIYSYFIYVPFVGVARSASSSGARVAFMISAACIPVLGLLNNGFTERYTFWPALAAYFLYACSLGPNPRRSSL